MTTQSFRCAIYTRKSTDEGLDQTFNSLDAQREACQAYVLSQAGEGWTPLKETYDDGGFSGGTIERPGLQRLLANIDRGLVDVVVVYKIDRLTRSLTDFARIVEQFEKRNVSFVSVTQAFNTTTSMGRLTLNVLLSFAQFEREVTAERIRDKFLASRKKGIFMGGCPPLGYDAKGRKLLINEREAETVRFIFTRYLELSSLAQLRNELETKGIRTKAWVSARGKVKGGGCWYIGPLRHILHNRVYAGDAMHKGNAYPGEHERIVPQNLFDAVQAKFQVNRSSFQYSRTVGRTGLLTGLIFDDCGNAMSPSRSRRPDGRTYLYYVSQARIQRRDPDAMRPIPAPAIEEIVCDRTACLLAALKHAQFNTQKFEKTTSVKWSVSKSRVQIRKWVSRVDVTLDRVVITFDSGAAVEAVGLQPSELAEFLGARLPNQDRLEERAEKLRVTIPIHLPLRGGIKRVEGWDQSDWAIPTDRYDTPLIASLAQAQEWREWIEIGEILTVDDLSSRTKHDRGYVRRVLRLAFLAPDIQRAILTGRQPKTLTLAALEEINLPLSWAEQRTLLSFATR